MFLEKAKQSGATVFRLWNISGVHEIVEFVRGEVCANFIALVVDWR